MTQTVRVQIRLPKELDKRLKGKWGTRTNGIIEALNLYFTARERREKIPPAMNAELLEIRAIQNELRHIGVNLNQIAMQLNKVPEGAFVQRVDERDIREMMNELRPIIENTRAILRFWRLHDPDAP